MSFYLVSYTILFLIVALVVFIELVAHQVIFKTGPVQRIFGHPLLRYSLRRIGSALISVLLAIIVTFFLIRATVDIDQLCLTTQFSTAWQKLPEAVVQSRCEIFRAQMGFVGGPFEQLMQFLYDIMPIPKTLCQSTNLLIDGVYYNNVTDCRFFLFDLGQIYSRDVADLTSGPVYVIDYIGEKMMVSFPVGILASVVQIVLGYPLGMLMAKRKDGVVDKIGKAYIISIDAIPGVAYYYIWMSIFVAGFFLPARYDVNNFLTWLPPVLTIGFTGMAGIALWVRRYMIDEFNADYVKFARAKGLSEGRITRIHVFRNAVVPLVRTFPSAILGALLGSFYIERIYGINGIGDMLINANNAHDFFAVQGIVIVTALISIVSYLLGDIITAIADPRIKFTN